MSDVGKYRRRDFLRMGAASLGGIAASGLMGSKSAFGTIRTHPHESSLTELDPNSYIKDMKIHAHFNEVGHRAHRTTYTESN